MVMRGRQEAAGVLTESTQLRFRSRSAAFVLLIQVCALRENASASVVHQEE